MRAYREFAHELIQKILNKTNVLEGTRIENISRSIVADIRYKLVIINAYSATIEELAQFLTDNNIVPYCVKRTNNEYNMPNCIAMVGGELSDGSTIQGRPASINFNESGILCIWYDTTHAYSYDSAKALNVFGTFVLPLA